MPEEEVIAAYQYHNGDVWLYAGKTKAEVCRAINNIEDFEECNQLVIRKYKTTQAEIDSLVEY